MLMSLATKSLKLFQEEYALTLLHPIGEMEANATVPLLVLIQACVIAKGKSCFDRHAWLTHHEHLPAHVYRVG